MKLKELINKKLVKATNGRYYILKANGKQKYIGFKKEAEVFTDTLNESGLKTFDNESIKEPESSKPKLGLNPNESLPESSSDSFIKEKDLIPETLDDVLDTILDLNIDSTRKGDTSIYIDGIDQMRFDHPSVKSCPFFFYCERKKLSVNNGGLNSVRGMTVLSKLYHQKAIIDRYKITFNRDDTPKEDFITIGELIVCVMKRDQFFEKKAKQRTNGLVSKNKVMSKRQDLADAQGQEKNVEKIVDNLKSANSTDRNGMFKDKAKVRKMDEVLNSNLSEVQKEKMMQDIEIKGF